MDNETYLLRLPATDWDAQIARETNAYLATVEPDAEGARPGAFVDQPAAGWLGVHVFPLNLYSKDRRDEIVTECARIWDETTHGPGEPHSRFRGGSRK